VSSQFADFFDQFRRLGLAFRAVAVLESDGGDHAHFGEAREVFQDSGQQIASVDKLGDRFGRKARGVNDGIIPMMACLRLGARSAVRPQQDQFRINRR
jgi:hypothetical protein